MEHIFKIATPAQGAGDKMHIKVIANRSGNPPYGPPMEPRPSPLYSPTLFYMLDYCIICRMIVLYVGIIVLYLNYFSYI